MKIIKKQNRLLVRIALFFIVGSLISCQENSMEPTSVVPTPTPTRQKPKTLVLSTVTPIAVPGITEQIDKEKATYELGSLFALSTENKLYFELMGEPSIIYSYDLETKKIEEIPTPGISTFPFVIISPDGGLIAYSTKWGSEKTTIFDIGNKKIILEINNTVSSFSPDNQKVTIWKDLSIFVVDIVTGVEQKIYEIPLDVWENNWMTFFEIIWNPIGESIAFIINIEPKESEEDPLTTNKVIMVNLSSGEASELISYSKPIEYLSWSPDSRFLAYRKDTSYSSSIEIFDIKNQCIVGKIGIVLLGEVFWSPDGNSILFSQNANDLYLLNLETYFGVPYQELNCIE